ncbi:hypothetical protein ES703_86594 [subsurface metagenome]
MTNERETMDNSNQSGNPVKTEMCVVKIVVPVQSDENAFNLKHGIDNLVSTVDNARVDFTIKTMYGIPPNLPLPANFTPPKQPE